MTDPRWDEASERLIADMLWQQAAPGSHDPATPTCWTDARAVLATLADAGLLRTPQMAEVLAAAKAWRAVGPGSGHAAHVGTAQALLAAVDAWEATK